MPNKINLVNTMKFAATADFREEGIVRLVLDSNYLFKSTKMGTLDESYIQTKINAFEAKLGFPSGIQVSDIKTVIYGSINAVSKLIYMRKVNNAYNVDNSEKRKIGLGLKYHMVMTADNIYPTPEQAIKEIAGKTLTKGAITIKTNYSKKEWEDIIAYGLRRLYVYPDIFSLLDYFYGGVFTLNSLNEKGCDQLLDIVPSYVGFSDDAAFKQDVDSVTTVMANKLIQDFLEQELGLNTLSYDEFYDWRRDVLGVSLRIVEDINLIEFIQTTHSVWVTQEIGTSLIDNTTGKIFTYIPDTKFIQDQFDSLTSLEVDSSQQSYRFLMEPNQIVLGTPPNVSLVNSCYMVPYYAAIKADNTVEAWVYNLPQIHVAGALFSATELSNLSNSMRYAIPWDITFLLKYELSAFGSGTPDTAAWIIDVKRNYDLMQYPQDTYEVVRDEWVFETLFKVSASYSANGTGFDPIKK